MATTKAATRSRSQAKVIEPTPIERVRLRAHDVCDVIEAARRHVLSGKQLTPLEQADLRDAARDLSGALDNLDAIIGALQSGTLSRR